MKADGKTNGAKHTSRTGIAAFKSDFTKPNLTEWSWLDVPKAEHMKTDL
jgi:hypothetical protein